MDDAVPALPAVLNSTAQCTGLTCPDCAGTLRVQTEGSTGYLHFRCRTGHAFSLSTLLECKEDVLEQRLWTALTALVELAALLRDVDRAGAPFRNGCPVHEIRRRAERLDSAITALGRVVDANLPLVVGAEDISA